jgi:hypothetical protein
LRLLFANFAVKEMFNRKVRKVERKGREGLVYGQTIYSFGFGRDGFLRHGGLGKSGE